MQLVVVTNGCDPPGHVPQTGTTTVTEMEHTEQNQARLIQAIPPPLLGDSQERRNLVRRMELVNSPNRISWIHLLANDGRVIFYTSVRGKVSSLNSMLHPTEQVVTVPMPGCGGQNSCYTQLAIESPDLDGTYGDNPKGVFWFTQDGTYMEWNGTYFVSDHPMRLNQEPIMVMQVNGQGNAVIPNNIPTPIAVH